MSGPKVMASEGAAIARGVAAPRLAIGDGAIEGMKWLGLALMLADHVNKYLLHDSAPAVFAAGRLAMPLFAFVLAFNLARPGAMNAAVRTRVMCRLAVTAAVATVPFIALGGLGWGWWPLNIMTMLALTVLTIHAIASPRRGHWVAAVAVFIIGGAFVEFWWPGIAIGVAAWFYCRRPSWTALAVWIAAVAALYVINRNFWALAALPVIFGASAVRLAVPRMRWFFYAFYPAHLAVLWAIASVR